MPRASSMSGSQVDFDHARVVLHVSHGSFRKHPSFVQDRDGPRDAAHESHVVGSDDDRVLPGERRENHLRALDLLRGYTGLPLEYGAALEWTSQATPPHHASA